MTLLTAQMTETSWSTRTTLRKGSQNNEAELSFSYSELEHSCNYRPQRSCGQGNVFTRVCHSVHIGGSASVHAGIPPPGPDPLWHTPPGTHPSDTLWHTPLWHTPLWHPPKAEPGIRSMSGRYASYWNAFLFN